MIPSGFFRAVIFVDGGYLNKVREHHFQRVPVDFRLLPAALAEGKPVMRSYYYDCLPYLPSKPIEEDRQRMKKKESFFTMLENIDGWTVRKGHLRPRPIHFRQLLDRSGLPRKLDDIPLHEQCQGNRADGCLEYYGQKGVDVALATDMLTLAATRQITDVILVAGDNDFAEVVAQCKPHGVAVTLWYHPESCNDELRQQADQKRAINQALIDSVRWVEPPRPTNL